MNKKPRGLAAMSPERRREIQSRGGQASPMRFNKIDRAKHLEYSSRGGKKKKNDL